MGEGKEGRGRRERVCGEGRDGRGHEERVCGGEERNEEVSVCTRPPIVLVHMLEGCAGKRDW